MTTELDKLDNLVAETDASTAPLPVVDPNAPPEPPPPPGPDEQAADLVNMFAGLVIGYAPAAADVWTEQARTASAAVIAPLLVKYNFSLAAIPPELAAAIVVGPLLYKSATIVAEKIKVDRAAAAPVAKQVGDETAAKPMVGAPNGPDGAPSAGVHDQMKLYPQ